jgi:NADP-dependent aldehyde dehydrogenase
MHPGVFSQIQGGGYDVGQALVTHPLIKAVGFTGGLKGGRALFDLCAARPEPIPFYGELGSINPMFMLPAALAARTESLASGWAQSLTMGAGQFCTNPGIAVVLAGSDADTFASAASNALNEVGAQTMLTDGIASAYSQGRDQLRAMNDTSELLGSPCDKRSATPSLFTTTGKDWLANEALGEEVFGPLGLIVVAADEDEMITIANTLRGQLTCTLHLDDADTEFARLSHRSRSMRLNGSWRPLPRVNQLRCNVGWHSVYSSILKADFLPEHSAGTTS